MNERDIFLTALEKPTAEARSEYLSMACSGDSTLRQRVEGLLQMHADTDVFLQKPLVERLAEGVAALEDAAKTARDPFAMGTGSHGLEFLSPSEQPGSLGKLGHYEVQEVIGSGGMEIVLRAFDERLHRMVAIKVMAAQLATNATARKRFSREAQAQAAVSHDHIVTIHAVDEANGLPFLVMQYVDGVSLQERLDRSGPLELHEILRIGMQTASGLAAAHAQGLIHRDIKPANILLENGVERVKVTDFGLARAAADANLTQSGQIAGTPSYMSPEQARGEPVDVRTDLFSLGSVLYAMCTGRAPFRAGNSIAVLKRVCEDTPTPIREANSDVPDWLCAIVEKLQAKEPADRYQSASEVAQVLGGHLARVQHPSVLPLPIGVARPESSKGVTNSTPFEDSGRATQGRRRLVVAVAALVLLIGGLGLTEATGVTNLAGTVIRIFTPDGTLVVEVDDPSVKVTIEGDGGIVITGAGLEEIRLRPGSYKVHADRRGKKVPLESELVRISKGGREVVRVKLEGPPVQVVAKADKGAFVLFGGKGVEVGKFDTLAEAVTRAKDGDTIEIRGNGPFVTDPLDFGAKALTIRAGAGYAPVIKASQAALKSTAFLLRTQGMLTLEGLELHYYEGLPNAVLIYSGSASLNVAHCKLIANTKAHRGTAVNGQLPTWANPKLPFAAGGGWVWSDVRRLSRPAGDGG